MKNRSWGNKGRFHWHLQTLQDLLDSSGLLHSRNHFHHGAIGFVIAKELETLIG